MERFPQLNFPGFEFRVRQEGSATMVWDELRAMWLVMTPEEWVRRHLVRYLTSMCGVTAQLLSQEYPVRLGRLSQRADLVLFGRGGIPLLLAECKAPHVKIDTAVYAQAVRYNTVVRARYLFLTNGLKHFIYERTGEGEYRACTTLPDLKAAIP